jgi:signal peptidase
MGELLPIGSVCFVSTYSKYENIKSGDVISFRVSDDMLVTHRAEKIMDNVIITKGDANNAEDPDPVTKENYIGKTVFAIPHIGRLFDSLHTFKGALLLGIIAILLIISGIFYKKNKE